MTDKRMTIKRLALYILISFGLLFLMIFIYISQKGWTNNDSWYGIIASVAMLCPAVANILTRLITREGTEELMLNLDFNGSRRYYLIAFLVPVVSAVFVVIITLLSMFSGSDAVEMLKNVDYGILGASILNLAAVCAVSVIFGFGEEFGWRGYMTPKLEKLMPAPAALIVSGIIWGLWHAPLIACGHNFGKDYPGYPWVGIGLMCVCCLFIGVYLTALTKATGSALTAGFAHIVINNGVNAVALQFIAKLPDAENVLAGKEFSYAVIMMLTVSVVSLLVGIIILVICRRKKAKK